MTDDVISLLKVHEYFQAISEESLQEVVTHARITHHAGCPNMTKPLEALFERLLPPWDFLGTGQVASVFILVETIATRASSNSNGR